MENTQRYKNSDVLENGKTILRDYICGHWKEDWRPFAGEFAPPLRPEEPDADDEDLFSFPESSCQVTEAVATTPGGEAAASTDAGVDVGPGLEAERVTTVPSVPAPKSPSVASTALVVEPLAATEPNLPSSLPVPVDSAPSRQPSVALSEGKQPPVVPGDNVSAGKSTVEDATEKQAQQGEPSEDATGAATAEQSADQGTKRKADDIGKKETNGPGPRQKKRRVVEALAPDTTVSGPLT